MYRSVLCCLMLCIVVVVNAKIKDCGSTVGSLINVTVSNCSPDANKCVLKKKTSATIMITFNVEKTITAIRSDVHGILYGVPIPFPLLEPNGCKNSGLTCPLNKENGPFVFSTSLPIKEFYPNVEVDVQWKLLDEADKEIVCAAIPSIIR